MSDYVTPQKLRNAAAYIRKHGWTRGVYENKRGDVCAIGAWCRGNGLNPAYWDTHTRPADKFALANTIVSGDGAIHSWNDADGRTKDEVIETFEAAACRLEQKETI